MNSVKHFLQLINGQTVIVALLALGSTYACLYFNISVELPTNLISVAVVFPIVFSINAAYQRREKALETFASIRSHLVAIYYAHRDWPPGDTQADADRISQLIVNILQSLNQYFSSDQKQKADFEQIYQLFSDVSRSNEELRAKGMSGSEVSRINQYLRTIMVDFERMRNILVYRTPISLRTYSHVFLTSFPILFGPYFAYLSLDNFWACGFLVALVYSLVLVSLDNVQDFLENPYDAIGADDVNLDILEDYQSILIRENSYDLADTANSADAIYSMTESELASKTPIG